MKLIIKLFILFILFTSCNYNVSQNSPKEIGSLLWVNSSMEDSSIKIAVQNTLENSTMIIAQITWSPSDTIFFQNVLWYSNLAKESGKKLMINIDWQKEDRSGTIGNWSFCNDEVKNQFINDAVKIVNEYSPDYLTLGVEVNYYAHTDPKGYVAFVQTYNTLKNQLKQINSRIQIGLSFQLELLFNVHKDWQSTRSLGPLEALNKNLDYIGISTYPDMYKNGSSVNVNSLQYLDTLKKKYIQPIGISETGISSLHNTEEYRNKYIHEIFEKVNSLDLKFIVWGSIIDHNLSQEWNQNIGLIAIDGKPKNDFYEWRKLNRTSK
jgi:hypothetical protein